MKSHKELIAWQKAVALAGHVYRETTDFPSHELDGLTTQLRRAAVSIASNIAEGCARASRRELLRFLHIARGSVAELETQIEIARVLQLLTEGTTLPEDAEQVGRLINGLISGLKLQSRQRPTTSSSSLTTNR